MNITYKLDLLRRMRDVTVNGVPLYMLTDADGLQLWQQYEQKVVSIDMQQLANASDAKKTVQPKRIRVYFMQLAGLLELFIAFCIDCIRRPPVIIFGIDKVSDSTYRADFRLRSAYEAAAMAPVAYREVLHTNYEGNFFLRKRFVVYLETLDVIVKISNYFVPIYKTDYVYGNLELFTEVEKEFVVRCIDANLNSQKFHARRTVLLTTYMQATGTKAVWTLDATWHYHDCIRAAHTVHAPVYVVQHGRFTASMVGVLVDSRATAPTLHPDIFIVWSEYWKRELLALGSAIPENKIRVAAPKTDVHTFPHGGEKIILTPHEAVAPHEVVSSLIVRLLNIFPDYVVYIKVRPDISLEQQVAQYTIPKSDRVRFVPSLCDITSKPQLALGMYSTFLYDMVQSGIPIGVIDSVFTDAKRIVAGGLGTRVRTDENFEADVRLCLQASDAEIARRALLTQPSSVLASTIFLQSLGK